MPDRLTLRTPESTLQVNARGAEPRSWQDAEGREHLWQAGEAWRRTAPILFPVICRVPDDQAVVDGTAYPMRQHGFTRESDFDVLDLSADRVVLGLRDSDETRQHYPYAFGLHVTHELRGRTLTTTYVVENRDERTLPYALGWHPAFVWPLDGEREQHVVEFDHPEPAPFRRVEQNLLRPELFDSVVEGTELRLSERLFDEGAVIMPDVASTGLTYRAPSGRGVRLDWTGFTGVTLWMRDGGEFVCLETWRGLPARPEDVELTERADLDHLPPGETRTYTVTASLLG